MQDPNSNNPYSAPQSVVADYGQPAQIELAGRGMRLVGAIIDTIILMTLLVPIMFASGFMSMAMSGQQPGFGFQAGMTVVSFVVFVLVQGYFLNQSGQTIGKKLLGMKIVDVDGNKPDFVKLLGQRYGVVYAVQLIPVLGSLFGLINVLFIFREDRRCIHDLIAGTRVVVA
jgi:uncharacterized RDD family membrane protein YckC